MTKLLIKIGHSYYINKNSVQKSTITVKYGNIYTCTVRYHKLPYLYNAYIPYIRQNVYILII